MADVVFILGAGASADAGAPVVKDFLNVAQRLHERKQIKGAIAQKYFEDVFHAIELLQNVPLKWTLNLDHMEDMFAAFEMGILIKRVPRLDPERMSQLSQAMRGVITHTILETVKFPINLQPGSRSPYSGRDIEAPPPYGEFSNLVKYISRGAQPQRSVAVITFNYDLAVDWALNFRGMAPNYAHQAMMGAEGLQLLKLHGSINWGICSDSGCGTIVPLSIDDYFGGDRGIPLNSGRTEVTWKALDKVVKRKCAKCQKDLEHLPAIVPPTWNKEDHYRRFASVWIRAASELSEARSIFVIGYSLPPSDNFFRYLCGLGTLGGPRLDRFWVLNPDRDVMDRFRGLIGPGIGDRFRPVDERFDEAIKIIRKEFEQ